MTVHDQNGMHYEWDEPPRPQVLLIDDGAEAIKTLHEKFPEWAPFFACVEQTRRGARIAHQLADKGELKCAVVNVAESWAKLERESPMIGQSVVAEVARKLDRLERAGLPRPTEATVIGYGAVGQRVAAALMARGIIVHVYDSDASRLKNLPPGMTGHTDKGEALEHGGVTVSCVGARTLMPEDWESLPNGAVLVNAASADDELGPGDLLRYQKPMTTLDSHGEGWSVFQGKPISIGHPEAEAHSDTVVRLESGKELLLASNGFVVNMTGERDPIPPRYIQLTRSLLLMGAITATRADKPGLIDVPEDWQKAIVGHIESSLAGTGESLQKPLWDAVIDAPPEPPPAAVLEAARREKEEAANPKKKTEPTEPIVPMRAPSPVARQAAGKVSGYEIGRAKEGSFSYAVAQAMGLPDKDVTVEAAALYHAAQAANRALGWHLAVKLNPDQAGRATPEQLLAPKPNAERAKAGKDATVFEAYFGYHLRGLASYALQSRLKAAPSAEQLAEAMKTAATQGGVDLDAYVDFLKASADAGDRALATALAIRGPPRP